MPWSTPLLALLLSCGSAPQAPAEPPAPAEGGSQETASIEAAVRQWREGPDPTLHSAVLHACERGLEVEEPSSELQIVLGDALANVLLRPDLGLPYLEGQRDKLDGDGVDALLDAVARTGDLSRLSKEVELVTGEPLSLEHPTATVLIQHAAMDPHTGWEEVRDGTRAARLVEVLERGHRQSIDRPVESSGAALEALGMLLEGWVVEVVTARSTVAADTDPLMSPGSVPALQGRRRVLGYARSPAELRPPGVALDLARPPKVAVLAAEATGPAGGSLYLAAEGRYDGAGLLWLFAAADPQRVVTWMDATEDLLRERREGVPDDQAAQHLRDRYLGRLLRGD